MIRSSTPYQSISPVAMGLAMLISIYASAAFFVGWGFGVDQLVRHSKSETAMVPATTFAFLFSATALISAALGKSVLTRVLNALVVVLIAATVLTQLFGWSGIAAFVVFDVDAHEYMAPVTAVGFLLVVIGVNRLLAQDITLVNAIGIFGLSASFCLSMVKLGTEIGLSDLVLFAGVSLQTCLLFCLTFLIMCLATMDDSET